MALFDEHTWGAANPWESGLEHMDSGAIEWGRKSAFAYEAFDRGEALLTGGLQHLAGAFVAAPEAIATLVVVNPSGWVRTDLARVFLPAERVASGTLFSVIERATGRIVRTWSSRRRTPASEPRGTGSSSRRGTFPRSATQPTTSSLPMPRNTPPPIPTVTA
jgi:hypothetical protein